MIAGSVVVSMLFGLVIAALSAICMVIGAAIVWRWVQDRNNKNLYGYHQSPALALIGCALVAGGFFILLSIKQTMNSMPVPLQ